MTEVYMVELNTGTRIDVAFETVKAAEKYMSYLDLMHGIGKGYRIVGMPVFDEEYIGSLK